MSRLRSPPAPVPSSRCHPYAAFYGAVPSELGAPPAIVHGNCQAESLRVELDGGPLTMVRIPPVHELTAQDVPHLRRWAHHAEVIISQPVRAGYRGLPIGTADLLALARPRARVVIVPVVRFAGLYPEHAIIRPPHDPAASPPLVPYHSLRVLAEALGGTGAPLAPAGVRAVAAASLSELRLRERRHGTLAVSDLLRAPHFGLMRTINHPGNPLWLALAERVAAALHRPGLVRDPGRPLLDALHAPRDPVVIDSFGLDAQVDPDWHLDGRRVTTDAVREAHLEWYATHPDAARAGAHRHRDALTALGLR